MKIEIDLNDLFMEEGDEGLPTEELIRKQIIERLSGDLRKRLFDRMDRELSEVLSAEIQTAIAAKMPSMIDDIMNYTYTPISRYGDKAEPTTFRSEIIKSVAANMVYQPKQWASDENAFTKAVKSIVELKTKEIEAAIRKEVDDKFKADAIAFAVKKLSERLGIAK